MIEEPDKYVKDFINAGADYLAVHIEASVHAHRTMQVIKESGVKAGVSANLQLLYAALTIFFRTWILWFYVC